MFGAHYLRLTTGDLPYSSVAPCQERFVKVRGRRGFRGHVAHDLVDGATLSAWLSAYHARVPTRHYYGTLLPVYGEC